MAKSASLTAGLVAKKGEAAPVGIAIPAPIAATPPSALTPAAAASRVEAKTEEKAGPATVQGKDYFKALTVKLDKERYRRLKELGLEQDKSSQDLFVEALDLFLAAGGKRT